MIGKGREEKPKIKQNLTEKNTINKEKEQNVELGMDSVRAYVDHLRTAHKTTATLVIELIKLPLRGVSAYPTMETVSIF